MQIAAWLQALGLDQYEPTFRDNDIDADMLPRLTADDLKDLGVTSVGHRKKMLEAIAALALVAQAQGSPVEPSVKEAERRQLTVMFVDLVGSTALSQRLDPEDMRDVIRTFQNAVAGEITRFEGHVAEYMGDGVLAYFGWPRSHEDEAERAVRTALATVLLVAKLVGGGTSLSCRIGIATGLVVVGAGASEQAAAIGETPNLAARLQGIAGPGEVVVAETTRRLLGSLFDIVDLGSQDLKGIAAPVKAYAVSGERTSESRFAARAGQKLSPIVGREQELALLQERWRQARSGEGQLVLLIGEAGIGKSRIMQAMIDTLAEDAHVRIRYQCSPYYTSSALYPVLQQISSAAGLIAADTVNEKLDKLEALLARGGDATKAVPLIAPLLGIGAEARYGQITMAPQQQRVHTLKVLIEQLAGLAAHTSVLWAIEDVHWADPTTRELIEAALDCVAKNRVLAVATARPTYEHRFGGHPIVTRLTLNRLGRNHVARIVERITGGRALPPAILEEISRRTDGVPLFVEEMTKAVLESGLMHEAEGTFVLDAPLQGLTIPTSLHDSLMARLDRLQPVKQVAQTAAVIGREFEHPLLAAISPLPDQELETALDRLVEAELVFRRGEAPDASYQFKHALVRDAAYESLLRSRRQVLHGQIARTLEARFPDVAEQQPELLAHHLTEAGRPMEALPYWQQAGERAAHASANTEAVSHLRQAINLVESLPHGGERDRLELRLQTQLAGCLFATEGYSAPTTVATVNRAQELSESVSDPTLLFPVLYGQWVNNIVAGNHPAALAIAERFLLAADQKVDTGPCVVGHRLRGISLLAHGRAMEGATDLEKALSLYEERRHASLAFQFGQDQRASALTKLALARWCLGSPEVARDTVEEAIDRALASGHANSLAYALFWGGVTLGYLLGDPGMVEQNAGKLGNLLERHDMAMWRAYSHVSSGWCRSRANGSEEGALEIEKGISQLEASRTRYWRPFVVLLLADAHARRSDPEHAARALSEALDAANQQQELWLKPELEAFGERLRG